MHLEKMTQMIKETVRREFRREFRHQSQELLRNFGSKIMTFDFKKDHDLFSISKTVK